MKIQYIKDWQIKSHKIRINILLDIIKEPNTIIYHYPALDIYGYGNNEDEALKSFEIYLYEFFSYTLANNTLKKELNRLDVSLHKSIEITYI